MPADLYRGTVGGNDDATVERATGGFIDATLVVGGADLVLHDRKRFGEAHRQQGGFRLLAGAGEVAGHSI